MDRRLTLALVAVALAGCGDDPVRILEGACSFREEHRLALPDGPIVDDVALATDGARAVAVWSERAGAFVRPLDATGAASGEARRIGPGCDGGLAASLGEDGTLRVACGRRGREGHDDAGALQLYAILDAQVTTEATVGELGTDGAGVSLAVDRAGSVWVGWQRAERTTSEAWLARVAEGAVPERLSSPRFRASRPSLIADGDRVLAAWAETWIDPRGEVEGRVMLRAGSRAARPVAELAFDASLPVLQRGVEDDVLLGFRDRRPERSRPRFQVARVEDQGTTIGRVESAAHANARGPSTAVACGGHVFVVAPRTHSRTERLVSVRRYSRELVGQGPEMQIYEHGAAFEHADTACVDGRLVVLFASRRGRQAARSSVRSVAVDCEVPD